MTNSHGRILPLIFNWLLPLLLLLGVQCAWAEESLQLALPGDELYLDGRDTKIKLSKWVANQNWYALSLKDNVLAIEPVTTTTEADLGSVTTGRNADHLLEGKPLKGLRKRVGIALKPPLDTLLLLQVLSSDGDVPPFSVAI